MIFFFKLTHGLLTVDPCVVPAIRNTTCTRLSVIMNIAKYCVPKCNTTTYQRLFIVRATRIWNKLADDLKLSTDNLKDFKKVMLNYYESSLSSTYDINNPRTFKTICLISNVSRSLKSPVTCCYYTIRLHHIMLSLTDPYAHILYNCQDHSNWLCCRSHPAIFIFCYHLFF